MKYRKSFYILTLAVSFSLLATIAMPAQPALAQSITLYPTSGFLGTTVTVTGTSFNGGDNGYVYLYFGEYRLKSIEVSETGTFTTDFDVPSYVMPGTYYEVTVQDEDGITVTGEWFIVEARIDLYPGRGKTGDRIAIGGRYFDADKEVSLYFSSDKASIGDNIDREVTAYEYMGEVDTNADGDFETLYNFYIPGELTDGTNKEDVHSGDYYIYATHFPGEKRIKAVAKFSVIGGEIEIHPTSGSQGTEVTVTGTDFYRGDNGYVYLYFGSYRVKSIEVSETGTFTTDFEVPYFIRPGRSYNVTVQDEGGVTLASAEKQFVVGAKIYLYSDESLSDRGKIDQWIKIGGYYFNANTKVSLYFSSDKASISDSIDQQVTAYEYIGQVNTNANGDFETLCNFCIPSELTDGEDEEDVHSGDYYIYATYPTIEKLVKAVAKFVVLGIKLSPEEGTVNSEVEISGEDPGENQRITVEYDEDGVEIAGGDDETDSEGRFTCSIIIPESVTGDHTIAVTVASGDRYEAVFGVKPGISIVPTEAAEGDEVRVSGTGFEAPYYPNDYITITLDGYEVLTKPTLIQTNPRGSFNGSFIVPSDSSRVGDGTIKVEAHDESFNTAEVQLTILAAPSTPATPAAPAGINLYPPTSLTSPGHVGMELTVDGTGFIANATVTITYGNHETITVATATSDDSGNFSATFSVPPSLAGDHAITCTDGTNTATSIFITESEAPPIPVSPLSQVATILDTKAYFDWEDVEDVSGVTYTFQVASDADFTTIALEKKGLTKSEYTITRDAKLEATEEKAPYYWRIKAVDGAFNESKWTPPRLLYVDLSQTSIPRWNVGIWALGICIGIGIVGLLLLIYAFRR
ncbi:IPT/TIG domain-containing protein [Chloroflexota bacterium]